MHEYGFTYYSVGRHPGEISFRQAESSCPKSLNHAAAFLPSLDFHGRLLTSSVRTVETTDL